MKCTICSIDWQDEDLVHLELNLYDGNGIDICPPCKTRCIVHLRTMRSFSRYVIATTERLSYEQKMASLDMPSLKK